MRCASEDHGMAAVEFRSALSLLRQTPRSSLPSPRRVRERRFANASAPSLSMSGMLSPALQHRFQQEGEALAASKL